MSSSYGSATLQEHRAEDGSIERIEVVDADQVIGISLELLGQAMPKALWIDADGLLWLGGDPNYRYRPVRFESTITDIPAGHAVEGARLLICERVT